MLLIWNIFRSNCWIQDPNKRKHQSSLHSQRNDNKYSTQQPNRKWDLQCQGSSNDHCRTGSIFGIHTTFNYFKVAESENLRTFSATNSSDLVYNHYCHLRNNPDWVDRVRNIVLLQEEEKYGEAVGTHECSSGKCCSVEC